MKRALLVIAVAASPACQQGSPPPSAAPPGGEQGRAVHAPTADAARVIDATPDAGDPTAHLFELAPALATRDGKLVLVKVIDDDSARGQPNLTLELRDRNDHAVDRVVVLALDETPDEATRTKRAAAADKLIKSHELVPMVALDQVDGVGPFSASGSGAAMTVDWEHEHFTFTLNGKRVLDRAVPQKWRGGSYFDKGADLTCSNPDFLRNVYVAPDSRVAVVDVAYRGNDTCWEPTGNVHVVAW
ncbi:MAG TPA: hypothetical protein VFQ65_13810 [Kofleriaceae bacterium]|nr:hypothetical protein [Kofleriaceae bacterium]